MRRGGRFGPLAGSGGCLAAPLAAVARAAAAAAAITALVATVAQPPLHAQPPPEEAAPPTTVFDHPDGWLWVAGPRADTRRPLIRTSLKSMPRPHTGVLQSRWEEPYAAINGPGRGVLCGSGQPAVDSDSFSS
jgi:hypothetical protein